MASGTVIFRPSSDVNLSHTCSTGSTGYRLIADETPDDNSTYIYQSITGTSNTTVNSTFVLTGELTLTNIRVTAVRLFARGVKSGNGESATLNCYFAAGTTAGGSSANTGVTGTLGTSYTTVSATSDTLVTNINDYLENNNNEFPAISVRVSTAGAKGSRKDDNGYARVTQVYMELDYEEVAFEPPEEDPEDVYYQVTISSINADTTPGNGTVRILEGEDQTITIIPSDPLLTLATDNGVDITNQLTNDVGSNTYTVTDQVSGASYGFTMNNTTGYYTSENEGVNSSAAVCRLNLELDAACLVTIEYINYAEATYDYGIFSKVDTALATSNTADTTTLAYYRCNGDNDNSASAKTLTYTVDAGSHYIDIKYRKDGSTHSYNDTLQWKVLSITPTEASGGYSYTLRKVTERHDLVFIFGNVTYYYVEAHAMGGKAFPDGKMVKLVGDEYNLTIIPDDINASVVILDNNVEVTSQLHRIDSTDKNNVPIVNYTYSLTDINETHYIDIVCTSGSTKIFIKENGGWVQYSKVYVKENGSWVEKTSSDWADVFNTRTKYKKG